MPKWRTWTDAEFIERHRRASMDRQAWREWIAEERQRRARRLAVRLAAQVAVSATLAVAVVWGVGHLWWESGRRAGYAEAQASPCWLTADTLSDLASDRCEDVASVVGEACEGTQEVRR